MNDWYVMYIIFCIIYFILYSFILKSRTKRIVGCGDGVFRFLYRDFWVELQMVEFFGVIKDG